MNDSYVNLMSKKSLQRQAIDQATWLWLRVLAVVVVTLGLVTIYQVFTNQEAKQRQVALEAQHEPIQQLRSELKLLRTRISSLYVSDQVALRIANAPQPLSLLAVVSQAALASSGEAYVESFSFTQPDLQAAGGKNEPQHAILSLEGLSRDDSSIAHFVEKLRESKRFSEVRLTSTEAQLLRGTATTTFSIDCDF